jgi:hypothetical protein
MPSNLFIYLIGLFLAIQGARSVITVDPTSCAAYPATLRAVIDEVVEIANAAASRTENAFTL